MAMPPQESPSRRGSRRRGRSRTQTIKAAVLALAIVVLSAGAGAAWRASRDDDTPKVAASTTTTTTAPAPEFEPYVTATSNVPDIAAYETPVEGAPVVETFAQLTEYLVPRAFLVIDQQPGWLQVLLPMRPNQSTGWIRDSEVTLGQSEYDITVQLSTTTVTLLKAGEVVLESPS